MWHILPIVLLSLGLVLCACEIKNLRKRIDIMDLYCNRRVCILQTQELLDEIRKQGNGFGVWNCHDAN